MNPNLFKMIKHGTSHGFSVLACTIVAAFLIELIRPYFPKLFFSVNKVSIWMLDKFHIPLSMEYLSIAIIASALAILWGFFFKLRFVE